MIIAILGLLLCGLVYAPQLWVRHVLATHRKEINDLPGTGGELAQHLLDKFYLTEVDVKETVEGSDHYSPDDNCVCLSPTVLHGKSLTAIAVAAHEVGHAIQFNRNEPVTHLRKRYLRYALITQRLGASFLVLSPVLFSLLRVPHPLFIMLGIGLFTMVASVIMYAAILPEEFDASFNKALPILIDGEYIKPSEVTSIRTILRACALTYVAAALADILSLWRWLALIVRR